MPVSISLLPFLEKNWRGSFYGFKPTFPSTAKAFRQGLPPLMQPLDKHSFAVLSKGIAMYIHIITTETQQLHNDTKTLVQRKSCRPMGIPGIGVVHLQWEPLIRTPLALASSPGLPVQNKTGYGLAWGRGYLGPIPSFLCSEVSWFQRLNSTQVSVFGPATTVL